MAYKDASHLHGLLVSRICKHCAEEFVGHSSAKFCSMKCTLLGKSEIDGECRVWTGVTNWKGYGYWQAPGMRRGQKRGVHRLAFEAWVRPLKPGELVRHTCDNPRCIRPEHLLGGTDKENKADMMGRKRHLHGDRHPFARLNEVAVRQIRLDERSAPELAPIYGVGAETIRLVRQRKIWKHVD